MKTLVLILSAAFLGVVAPYPRAPIIEKQHMTELYLIPQGRIIHIPQHLRLMDFNDQELESEMALTEEIVDIPEENLNEYPKKGLSQEHPVFSCRSKRSTQPGANVPQGGGHTSGSSDRGKVDLSISRGEGGCRRVEARGEGNVWQSRDGRGRVDVHGHYSRDYGGRYGTGRPQYGGGIRYTHRF